MGGWYISTDDGSETYLNLPERVLLGQVMGDMDDFESIDTAILSPACDPDGICSTCPYADGFTFDGDAFRTAMQRGLNFLSASPDWQRPNGGNRYSRYSDRQIAQRVPSQTSFGLHLVLLSGGRVYFRDAMETGLGICPEGAPYRRKPENLRQVPAYLGNVWESWRYRALYEGLYLRLWLAWRSLRGGDTCTLS